LKQWLLKPPIYGDFLRLLMAWRVWVAGAVLGAIVTALIYVVAPPQYRAQATVLVDQNLEQALPPDTSSTNIYIYLQRETDKLIVIAWADTTLAVASNQSGIPVAALRDGRLHLSQSGDGGWHFFADAPDAATAAEIASAWAISFYSALQDRGPGVSTFLQTRLSQVDNLPVQRKVPLGVFTISGAIIGAMLLAFLLLFFDRKEQSRE
jgi:uncharacterized integral membrane protein